MCVQFSRAQIHVDSWYIHTDTHRDTEHQRPVGGGKLKNVNNLLYASKFKSTMLFHRVVRFVVFILASSMKSIRLLLHFTQWLENFDTFSYTVRVERFEQKKE